MRLVERITTPKGSTALTFRGVMKNRVAKEELTKINCIETNVEKTNAEKERIAEGEENNVFKKTKVISYVYSLFFVKLQCQWMMLCLSNHQTIWSQLYH